MRNEMDKQIRGQAAGGLTRRRFIRLAAAVPIANSSLMGCGDGGAQRGNASGGSAGTTNMLSGLDYTGPIPGYDQLSAWPCECGGPRRQKACGLPGLSLGTGEQLSIVSRSTGLANAMVIHRGSDELYLQGRGRQSGQSFGWLEKVDPQTLEALFRSPDLPSGGHNYVGAAAVHENRDIYIVNGRYCHRLNPECEVVAERMLPVDAPYNGFQIVSDGNLVMKNLGVARIPSSTFAVLEPERLEIVSQLEMPAKSVGRFTVDRTDDGEFIYATTDSAVLRFRYEDGVLVQDSWQGNYDLPGLEQSFAWDNCIAGGRVWFTDSGMLPIWESLVALYPVGVGSRSTNAVPQGPLSLFAFSVEDGADVATLQPFGSEGPFTSGPPLVDQERSIVVAYDIPAQKVGAWRFDEATASFDPLWLKDILNTQQMLYYPDTGELLVNDAGGGVFGVGEERVSAILVLDIESGEEKARIETNARARLGMWFTPGFGRDFYYMSRLNGGSIERVVVG